jgi:hypothetical protein
MEAIMIAPFLHVRYQQLFSLPQVLLQLTWYSQATHAIAIATKRRGNVQHNLL